MPSTTVKERPILFSGEMVRAILDGRKTQTRRILTPQPSGPGPSHAACIGGGEWVFGNNSGQIVKCPYGSVGDRLWVREAFDIVDDPAAYHVGDGPREPIEYEGETYECADAVRRGPNGERWVVDYAADKNTRIMDKAGTRRWRPSIHMPRWASRLTLEITGVRVERVQDISEEDAKTEGINPIYPPGSDEATYINGPGGFRCLWDQINGAGAWERNDWLWVISFKRLTKEGE